MKAHLTDAHRNLRARKARARRQEWREARSAVPDAPAIVESLDVSPVMVRATLNRLLETARRLGLECQPPHRSRGKPNPAGKRKLRVKQRRRVRMGLVSAGKS